MSSPKRTNEQAWYIVDATDMILGRLASKVALVISGKGKPTYAPHLDHGDHVIVVNADKVRLTGRKVEIKTYFRHSTYPGGGKFRSFKEQMNQDPTQVVVHAVRGMVPKTNLGRQIMKKLHVYRDGEHPHTGQKPAALPLK